MLNKRIGSILVAGMLMVSMVGCSNTSNPVDDQQKSVKQEQQVNHEQILVDNEVIKITITETEFQPYDEAWEQGCMKYKVLIENKTNQDIMVSTNGITESDLDMSGSHYMTETVQANKKIFSEFNIFIDPNTKDMYKSEEDFDDIVIDFYVCETTNYNNLIEWTTVIKNCVVQHNNDNNKSDNSVTKNDEVKDKKEKDKKYCDWCEDYAGHSTDEHVAQCYDCGEYKKVKDMEFNGRSFHCGCVDQEPTEELWVCPGCDGSYPESEMIEDTENGIWYCYSCYDEIMRYRMGGDANGDLEDWEY